MEDLIKKYDLDFYGEVYYDVQTERLSDIQDSVARTLKILEKDQSNFFSGKKIKLKTDSTYDEVLELKNKLEKIRVKTHIFEKPEFKNDLTEEDIIEIQNKIPSKSEAIVYKYFFSRESDPTNLERSKPKILSIFKGWSGRMNRMYYISGFVFALFFLGFFTKITVSQNSDSPGALWALLGLWGMINVVRFTILRLHDIGATGWFTLMLLIPYLNIIFVLFLFVAPGVVGSNRFGNMG